MTGCTRVGCNKKSSAANPMSIAPQDEEWRKRWLMKAREGTLNLGKYMETHMQLNPDYVPGSKKPEFRRFKTNPVCCYSHFHPSMISGTEGRRVIVKDGVPMSKAEADLYIAEKEVEAKRQAKVAETPLPVTKILRGRAVPMQPSGILDQLKDTQQEVERLKQQLNDAIEKQQEIQGQLQRQMDEQKARFEKEIENAHVKLKNAHVKLEDAERTIKHLQLENAELAKEASLSLKQLNYERITSSDEFTSWYTGFLTTDSFKAFLGYTFTLGCAHAFAGFTNDKLKKRPGRKWNVTWPEALVMTLMKLRLDFPYFHMQYLFGLSSQSQFDYIFHFSVGLLYIALCKRSNIYDALSSTNFRDNAMKCFKDQQYENVALIIDATEFFCETPSDPTGQQATWSPYKNHNTFKVLIGIRQSGEVAFVSLCYPGRISDKELTRQCKVFQELWPDAVIMVDKGFLIDDIAEAEDIHIIRPAMLAKNSQLSSEDQQDTKSIANVRIHVERVIRKAKEMRMLSHEVRISSAKFYSKLVATAFFLTNYMGDCVIPSK